MTRRRVVIGNNKGGVGKTTATVNLAAALAEAGLRVLVVDLDPQANASRRLGVPFDPSNPTVGMAEVVQAGAEGCAADAVVPCAWPAPYSELIDVVPSRFDLENRISEAAVLGATSRLRRALNGVDDDYAVTLLDCPPSLGHLTQLGLAVLDGEHDGALCVLEPEYDAIEGGVRFRDFIDDFSAETGRRLRLLGYLVSRVRAGVGAHSFQIEGLADTFGENLVWTPHIPERAAIKDAADTATPPRALSGTGALMAGLYADLAARLRKELNA